MARRTTAALTGLVALLLTACTTSPDGERGDTPSPTPSAEPQVQTAETALPTAPTTVLSTPDAVAAATAMSSALYDTAPVVVLAPDGDVAAQLRAASAAVALGAPLLLAREGEVTGTDASSGESTDDDAVEPTAAAATTSPTASATAEPVTPDPTAEELERLDALAVLTVGDVTVDGLALDVVPAPEDDDALAALVDLAAAPVEVPAGGETVHVAGLVRDDTSLLVPAPEPAPEPAAEPAPEGPDAPAPEAGPAAPTPTARPTGSSSPTAATPDTDADTDAGLPLTERAPAPTGGAVLTTGAATDLAAVATARAAGVEVVTVPTADPRQGSDTVQAVAGLSPTAVVALGDAFGTPEDLQWKIETAATGVQLPGGGQLLFPGKRMVALYGTPGTSALGLLGEQDLPGSITRAQGLAAEYQPLTDDVVVPAFEIIATVASASAGADGNYSNELPAESFVPWIEAARDAGIYVVLDLQPGRTDFVTQARLYEQLLLYPNVGLALDPEWRLQPDQVHLRQIGSVHVDEVNAVADYLAQLTRENALPQKLLILHQFRLSMIRDRQNLDTSDEELAILIHADGQGSQPAKRDTWQALRNGAPEGVWWGWKNFIDEDLPTLTPAQTFQVEPTPDFVSYQ